MEVALTIMNSLGLKNLTKIKSVKWKKSTKPMIRMWKRWIVSAKTITRITFLGSTLEVITSRTLFKRGSDRSLNTAK
jgi:hypothetical protein